MEVVLGENEVHDDGRRFGPSSFEPDHLVLDRFLDPFFCPARHSRCRSVRTLGSFLCMGAVGACIDPSCYLERQAGATHLDSLHREAQDEVEAVPSGGS
jgi:hypothetical protein